MNIKTKETIKKVFLYLCLIFGVCLIAFPMYITIVNSFKSQAESSQSFFTLPSSFYLENFKIVIGKKYFLTSVFNTVLSTTVSITVIAVFTPLVSYAIVSNKDNKFFKFLLYYITGGMFVPFQVVALPLAIFMSKLHLTNRFGIIIIYITYAMIMCVFLYTGYLKTLPKELEEAAYIDGCGILKSFFKIVYPLALPMTATIIIINFLWIWNEFLIALMLLNSSQKFQTLILFIYGFKGQYTFEFNLAFAALFLSILPIMIIYSFLQKYIVTGLSGGSVKG